MATEAGEKPMERIRFGESETGWAEMIDENTAKIMNIPAFTDDLLLFDTVQLTHASEDGLRRPKRILKREFEGKAAFYYKSVEAYHKAVKKLKAAGCLCEAWIAPDKKRPGIVAVVYPKGCDVVALAVKAGLSEKGE